MIPAPAPRPLVTEPDPREPEIKWTRQDDRWVRLSMIRTREGQGWIETHATEEMK